MEQSPVLIISHDIVGPKMAGPGIRYWELARVLAHTLPVVLATPNAAQIPDVGVRVWSYQPGVWESIAAVVETAATIVLCGDVLAWFPQLVQCGKPLVIDGYDPHPLETLALFAGTPEQAQRHQERERILQMQCRAGDFFICASERQRDWWLGLLEANGRVNAQTYQADPSLRRLVDVVPFGLPAQPPQHTKPVLKGVAPGIGPEAKVILWGGGLWEWLDPLTLLRAFPQVLARCPEARLVFPGTQHPNNDVPAMRVYSRATQLVKDLSLESYVFFGEWVPYADWQNYLLEADVGVALHFDTLETRMAFRTRVLDYIWAGLPMVLTEGDATSDLVVQHGLGRLVAFGDVDGVALALLDVLAQPREAWEARFPALRVQLMWERAAEPLLRFCQSPHCAADRAGFCIPIKREGMMTLSDKNILQQIESLEWYHTLDLGNGITTPGDYDHRPYLPYYGFPDNLTGKTALDVGAASGFFSFEMERRGAKVTAVDLPTWLAHDFGPCYRPDKTEEEGASYLHSPFLLAKQVLHSSVEKVEMSVYDLDPEKIGLFDLVFCGSMLLHITDPVRALWRLQSVTREVAIIATVIYPDASSEPLAQFVGHHRGDGWWFPNRACFEMMVKSAGFAGWEWYADFRLDYRDGSSGPYHGVIRAWNTPAKPPWLDAISAPARDLPGYAPIASIGTVQTVCERDAEIARLRALVEGYERGRFIRLMKWLRGKVQPGR